MPIALVLLVALFVALPVIALIAALSARATATALKDRLAALERALAAMGREAAVAAAAKHHDGQSAAEPTPSPGRTEPAEPTRSVPPPQTPAAPPPVAITLPASAVDAKTPAKSLPSHPSESFEQTLGTRWAVWAGGLALALGGLFLVRYSIDAGLIGPGVRIGLGLLLAAALTGAGEWFRRSEIELPIAALPQAHIPSILTAAGTVIAFGTIYAAHALYGFIGPAATFIALGATGIAAMLAAALHGPALAGLGLAGAFVAPLLVQSDVPNPWPVVLYLAVVAAAAYLLARTRAWLWLAAASVAGAAVWGLVLLAAPDGAAGHGLAAPAVHTLLQLGLAAFFLAVEPYFGQLDRHAKSDTVSAVALGALTGLTVLILFVGQMSHTSNSLFAASAIAILGGVAWLSSPAAAAACLAGGVALARLLDWPGLDTPVSMSQFAPWTGELMHYPDNLASFMSFAAISTLGLGGGALLRIWRGPALSSVLAGLYSLAATVPPLLALIIAYLRITQFDISIPFAAAGLLLAGLFAIAAEKLHRAGHTAASSAYHLATGACAAAAIAGFAFALSVSLERGYLTVALALSALGAAYVATLRDIPLLRHAVTALGLAVLARLVWDPRIMGSGIGATPVLNWLLIGYGVPAASFALAARLLERRGNDMAVRVADSLAVIFTGLLAFFEARHLTNGGDVYHHGAGHAEAGLMTLLAIGLSFALARLNLRKSNPVFDMASMIFGAGSIVTAAFGLALTANPLFNGDMVGGSAVFSSLLPAYLFPGLAALFVARHTLGLRPEWYRRAAGILGVALIVLYVSLEVRHVFQGANISIDRATAESEHWAHSFAWLILGVVFLAYGLVRQSLEARIASALLIVLAALKITLFDLAGIGGLWRALSFLCLGAVLIGIGLVYQKIIFAPSRTVPDNS